MNPATPHPYAASLRRARQFGVGAGMAGLVLALVCLVLGAEPFFQGYLYAFTFWTGLSLGCLSLLMLHHLTAGDWGFVMQRHLEAGAMTIALMAVLVVPLFFGMHTLYGWTHEAAVSADAALQHKKPYLNVPFYLARHVVYFAFWIGAALLLRRWSQRLDETGDARYVVRMRALAAGGLIGHIMLLTFATVDWVMSLEPDWHSTIYCWTIAVSEALTALAFTVIAMGRYRRRGPLAGVVRVKHFHDYGNLLLAFVILWTYMSFAQYLITWSGNVPSDTAWYVHRQGGAWAYFGPFLIAFHFAVPFLLLLSRRTKRSVRALTALAAGLLAAHLAFLAWLILPAFTETTALTYLAMPALFVGMGGLWIAVYAWQMATRPVLSVADPRLPDALKQALHAG